MKIQLLLLLFLLTILTSCQKEISETELIKAISENDVQWNACFETEEGVFGTLTETQFTKSYQITEGCKNRFSGYEDSKEFLVFSCENEKPVLINNLCISGCFKNACVPLSSCTDSDGGKNFFDTGEIEITDKTGNKDVLEDACYPGNVLGELHCIGSYEVGFENYVCPFGCVQGRCLEEKDKLALSEDLGEEVIIFPKKTFLNVIPRIATLEDEVNFFVGGLEENVNSVQVIVGKKSFQLFDDGFHRDGLARDGFYGGLGIVSEVGSFDLNDSYLSKNNIGKIVKLDNQLIVAEETGQNCEYFSSSQESARINIVVTAVGYGDEKEILEKVIDYKDQFAGIFSVEPFKSNKELFDVWYVSAENIKDVKLPEYFNGVEIAKELKKGYLLLGSCKKPNQFNLIIYNSADKLENGDDLSYGQYKYAYTFYDPKTSRSADVIHEFVHSFGGLVDEYTTDSVSDQTLNEQCYYSPHVKCFSGDNDEEYSCQETTESYNDCLVNAPWKSELGNGCGKLGIVDCKPIDNDFNLEVNCFLGCGRQKNLYRSTYSSGMRKINVPFELGPVNEKLLCETINNFVGFNKGVCLKYG